jgi:hypothetical protein
VNISVNFGWPVHLEATENTPPPPGNIRLSANRELSTPLFSIQTDALTRYKSANFLHLDLLNSFVISKLAFSTRSK